MTRMITYEGPAVVRFEWYFIPEPYSGCWLWTRAAHSGRGYGTFRIDGCNYRAHRVAWQLYRGSIPKGIFVLHRCDTPSCVNPDHLFLGNSKDNIKDAARKKRMAWGIHHPSAKLTERKIYEIRAADGTYAEIGRKFGIGSGHVAAIKRRKVWKNLD